MSKYLLRREGGMYYFRRTIPHALRPYFGGMTQWMFSLKVKDQTRANRLRDEEAVRTNKLLEDAEARSAAGESPPPVEAVRTLTTAELAERERDMFEWQLENDRFWREQDWEERYGRYRHRREMAEIKVAVRAEIEAEHRIAREVAKQESVAKQVPFMEMFDGYVAERQPSPATVKRWRPMLEHLKAHVGHDDAFRVTVKDALDWKAKLLSEPDDKGKIRAAKTVREGYIAAAKVVFGWGLENQKVAANPFANVTVRVPKKVRLRDPGFNDDEAQKILKATLRPMSRNLSAGHALARRWIPWLCAYTGARVNEITQLRGEDIKQIGKIWTIRITPEAGGVKDSSARTVPLHSHLIEQGFADIVKGDGPLFYDPERGRGGSDANPQYKKIGERLAKWVRGDIGIDDPFILPNHAWRHRFKTTARRVGIPDVYADAIQGHAPDTEGQKYGIFPVETLAAEIEKLPRFEIEKPNQQFWVASLDEKALPD